ncbi:hypothetical protein [Desertivirga arenae]|uniref:hypothetical protein n=1 Tax=Desertivirga arenae TaxID=2810309 RepID=UPI001A96845A|nr:hypothetical protein [Pedobacter sp. SYSU D00823]
MLTTLPNYQEVEYYKKYDLDEYFFCYQDMYADKAEDEEAIEEISADFDAAFPGTKERVKTALNSVAEYRSTENILIVYKSKAADEILIHLTGDI